MKKADYAYIGKNFRRKGSVERVTGANIFAVDMSIPGMLRGGILRSQYAHARIRDIDVSEAVSLPGVYAVVTAKDAPDVRYGRTVTDRYILARNKVFFIGDPVAAVAANSLATVKKALRNIQVEYEPLSVVLDPEEAMKPEAPTLHEDVPPPPNLPEGIKAKNVCSYISLHVEHPDQAMAEADLVVEEIYKTQMVHPHYLEPRTVIAEYDNGGNLTLRTNSQTPFVVRSEVSRLLQLPVSNVRVLVAEVGGGFGGKAAGVASGAGFEPICGLLAMKAKRPVMMVLDKSEETIATSVRGPAKVWIQTGVQKNGTILARKAKLIFDTGGYSGAGELAGGWAARMLVGCYRIPNVHIDGYVVYTNKQVCGPVRGPGGVQAIFPVESHMDSIASRLNMDPVDFRLKNMLRRGDRIPNGVTLRDVSLKETLLTAAEKVGWGKIRLRKNQGIGFASTTWGGELGHGPGAGALVKVNEDGSATVLIGKVDYGSAVNMAIPMIVAEELGIDIDHVKIVNVDTDTAPWDFGTVGSLTTVACGGAARLAARDARNQLLRIAAKQLNVRVRDLAAKGGQIRVKGFADKVMPISIAATAAHFQVGEVIGRGTYDPETISRKEKEKGASPSYATHAALVQVDPDTGRVDVSKYVAVHDVGFAINPCAVEGQIEGGVVQGLGQALCEQILTDDTGRTLNPTFVDYLMPTANITPDIEPVILEGYLGTGPYGAKGIGEIPCVLPPAVIANAIFNATGVRIRTLPLTPENVLRAIREQKRKES